MSKGGKKRLDTATVHFGVDVVALEKDEMFRRVTYSVVVFFPAFSKNVTEGCRSAVE